MASIKQVIVIILISGVIIGGIGLWVNQKNASPELLLEDAETLDGPLAPEELEIAKPEITNTMNRIAVLNTNKGVIKIELFEDHMPITTANFTKLAGEGFYDETKFHRVIDGFMIQGGDPNSRTDEIMTYGTGGPEYTIQDEFVEGEHLTNTRGTIAMANTGQPNSGGSQFFINLVDNTALDFDKEPFTSKHPVFGRVIEGMDVIDAIAKVDIGERDIPVEPVIIDSVRIESQG
jgi:peptidylprolyl isomerase